MNTKMKVFKISMNMPKRYLEARKVLKDNNDAKAHEIMKDLSNKATSSLNKKLEVVNLNESLDLDGALIISNHQENLDIFLLVNSFKEQLRFVAKKELFHIFMFKTYINLSKSYSLDRSNPREGVKVFKKVVEDVNNGINVVVFPEGTRAKSDLMLDFNSGLFNIFRRVQKPIIPVYIDGSYDETREVARVIIGKPIDISEQKVSGTQLKSLVYQSITKLKKEYGLNNTKHNILALGDSITFGKRFDGEYTKGFYGLLEEKLANESKLGYSNNLAIPGATIDDLNNLLDLDNYNEQINNALEDKELVKNLIEKNNLSIHDFLARADYLVLSIGANDILKSVANRKITTQDLYDEFENMYAKTLKLLEKISRINKNLKIIYIGQYFPYPHSKVFQKYNLIKTLDLYINKLAIKYPNILKVIISQDVFDNKDTFLPNKRDIHLSDEGYEFVGNKVIDVFASDLRKGYGYKK